MVQVNILPQKERDVRITFTCMRYVLIKLIGSQGHLYNTNVIFITGGSEREEGNIRFVKICSEEVGED